MKYFLVAGEASGDLHGSNLMAALKQLDPRAQFCYFGGDLMEAEGGKLLKHYREMAFMGFIPVLLNLRTILRNLKTCQQEVLDFKPDVLILIDYPGFNLKLAKFIKTHSDIRIYYYISPKVWAWKEYRVESFKRYVDDMFSILPFEIPFYKKHNYYVYYVGNPTVDAVENFRQDKKKDSFKQFVASNRLKEKPVIALLAGSRQQEIKDNLPSMLDAVKDYMEDYQVVVAGAPGIEREYYRKYIKKGSPCKILFDQTYRILQYAKVAVVTSGTATLETALFRVPQVVCYKTPLPRIVHWCFEKILHTKYISLVNLIADRLVVKELFAKFFSVEAIRTEVDRMLNDKDYRAKMLADYDDVIKTLGESGASARTAQLIVDKLKRRSL